MDKQDNFLVNKFLKQISKIIDHKLEKLTTVESAIVDQVNIDGSVNLHIPPDSTIFTGIQNQSIYQNLKVGDCVKVLKQHNKASNMWIIGGHNLKRNDIKIGKDVIDVIYPIGFVYISINNINPSTLFGGKWERIKGRFLLAAGENEANTTTDYGSMSVGELNRPVGELGGEATHKLEEREMPSHIHQIRSGSGAKTYLVATNGSGSDGPGYSFDDSYHDDDGNINGAFYATATGGGQPHNNMPPYLANYCWRRIA